jgi:hypothetical protein
MTPRLGHQVPADDVPGAPDEDRHRPGAATEPADGLGELTFE